MTEIDDGLTIIPDYLQELEDKYIVKEAALAFSDLDKEIKGEGCGCNNCLHRKVDTWNSWVEFIADTDDLKNQFHAYIDWSGPKPVVLFGEEPDCSNTQEQ